MVYSWYNSDDGWRFGVTRNVVNYNAYSNGYVYVVDREDFTKLHIPGEYISDKLVKPISVIKINPEDFINNNQISSLPLSYLTKSNSLTPIELESMGYTN